MSEDTLSVKLPDGTMITGPPETVGKLMRREGYKDPMIWYESSSKGWIKIADMHIHHIRNTILARYRKWVGSMGYRVDNTIPHEEFVEKILAGPDDITLVAMLAEVRRRRDED
jgi:hypothetical protein